MAPAPPVTTATRYGPWSGTGLAYLRRGWGRVHRSDVDVGAVVRDRAVPEPEHVAAGDADLSPVEADVVDVELCDQGVAVAPHVDEVVPEARYRGEEAIHGFDECGLALDRLRVPEAQANVVAHERGQGRDIFRVEGLEDGAGV